MACGGGGGSGEQLSVRLDPPATPRVPAWSGSVLGRGPHATAAWQGQSALGSSSSSRSPPKHQHPRALAGASPPPKVLECMCCWAMDAGTFGKRDTAHPALAMAGGKTGTAAFYPAGHG